MTAAPDFLRFGLIGAGRWGRNYIRTISEIPGARLTQLCSRNPESPGLVESDCTIHEDWQALISATDLDAVIVAAPPTIHAEIAMAAIDAGLPVLVEKPMTLDLAEAEKVLARAKNRGAIVRVDHIHLYSAAWKALKREARNLGTLRAISANAGRWGPFRSETPMHWDWGSHDVALCLDLVGRLPATVCVRGVVSRDTADGPGQELSFDLDFGDVNALIAISNLYTEKQRSFIASFDGGRLVYDDTLTGEDKLRLQGAPGDYGSTFKLEPGRPLERAVRAFAASVRDGAPDFGDVELSLDVTEVLSRLDGQLGGA